jgi:hypothetical protein
MGEPPKVGPMEVGWWSVLEGMILCHQVHAAFRSACEVLLASGQLQDVYMSLFSHSANESLMSTLTYSEKK